MAPHPRFQVAAKWRCRGLLSLLLALWVLLGLGALAGLARAEYPQAYLDAVEDAQHPTAEKIASLSPIGADNPALFWEGEPGSSRVKVVTWVSWLGYDNLVGQEYTLAADRELWVSPASAVQDFYGWHRLRPGDLPLRIEQLLGMPPDDGRTRMVELYVRPQDLFRPSKDPEIDDQLAQLEFPAGVSETHKTWFNKQLGTYTATKPYPWSQLGYTYDWGDTAAPHVGVSEYVVRGGSTVHVVASVPNARYFAQALRPADLWWHNPVSGANKVWLMSGTTKVAEAFGPSLPGLTPVCFADFNEDGYTDALFRNTLSGKNFIIYLRGTAHAGYRETATIPVEWSAAGCADFNADNAVDIYWHNSATGVSGVTYLDGEGGWIGTAYGPLVPQPWRLEAVADFDRDGKPDLLALHPEQGQLAIALLDGVSLRQTVYPARQIPQGWTIHGAGKFFASGGLDLVGRHEASGRNALLRMYRTATSAVSSLEDLPPGHWELAGVAAFQ